MFLVVMSLATWAEYLAWQPRPHKFIWAAMYIPTNTFTPVPISTPTSTSTPTATSIPTPTSSPTINLSHTPTESPTPTPSMINTSTPTDIATPINVLTHTPTLIPVETPASTLTPTNIPISTSTPTTPPTPFPLLPAVVIDDQETQLDKTKLPANNYRLLRWKPWSEEAPEGWYYLISFLPANNPDSVFFTKKVHKEEITHGEGANVDWLTYSFDILELPENIDSCYPYWDVVIVIDGLVNCPTERSPRGICRLTEFSERQQALATERPGVCPGGGSSSRKGSIANNRGPDDLDH